MPIYEYGCTKCGKHHEVMQKMSDAPLTTCPDCGGELKKKISNTSFVLKGTGWYATDYASDKKQTQQKPAEEKKSVDARFETTGSDEKKKDAKTEGEAKSRSESGAEPKSESKSESKSDTKADTGKSAAS
jgi:putative FmdB family regulatory protein